MAVEIKLIETTENGPVFEATDLETGEIVSTKNWYEKSKDKWHIVLGPNSANRKYVAHNEFFAKAEDDTYVVEDKTTGPRVLGTAEPDKKLVPYMTDEDREAYEGIIARAKANRDSQKAKPMTEEEKLQAQIAKAQAKAEKLLAQLAAMNNSEE